MAEAPGFERRISRVTVEVTRWFTTVYVGKEGVEPTCNQLTFRPGISRRVYLPNCGEANSTSVLSDSSAAVAGMVGVEPTTNGLADKENYEFLNLLGPYP